MLQICNQKVITKDKNERKESLEILINIDPSLRLPFKSPNGYLIAKFKVNV